MPKKKPSWLYRQSAAIPFRRHDGDLEVLLVTSVRRGRWIIPKGVVERDLTPAESARKEAWEEAGVSGEITGGPIGSYEYQKWGGTCTVSVFLLHVEDEKKDWPERKERVRRWVSFKKALKLVDDPDLCKVLKRAASMLLPD